MEWKEFSGTTLAWLKNDKTVDEADASTISRMIEKGNANPTRQVRISTTIREIARDYATAPYGQRGYTLPTEAQTIVNDVTAIVNEMATLFDNGGDAMRALLLPNQRSKVKHFPNGDAWASSVLKNVNGVAVKLSKDGTWDGSMKSLSATISEVTSE